MSSRTRTSSSRDLWKTFALAAALHGTVAAGLSSAQSVVVTRAPAGTAVELGLNRDVVDTGIVSAEGWATLNTKRTREGAPAEVPVTLLVDVCEDMRRVMIVEPGQQPLGPRAGCTRREIAGVFVMRAITTFVVDATESPSVRLRQGEVPKSWLVAPTVRTGGRAKQPFGPMPAGLVLFAGGGLSSFAHFAEDSCGTVADCSGKATQPAWTAGVTYWLSPFLGMEASYLQPGMVTATGQSDAQQFGSTRESRLLLFSGKVGGSSGRARIYAQGGATYGWSLSTVSQIVTDRPVDIDGVTQTIVGGAQKFQMETKGWGWQFAGGLEIWIKPKFGIYSEVGMATITGKDVHPGEGRVSDRAWSWVTGARFRLRR